MQWGAYLDSPMYKQAVPEFDARKALQYVPRARDEPDDDRQTLTKIAALLQQNGHTTKG